MSDEKNISDTMLDGMQSFRDPNTLALISSNENVVSLTDKKQERELSEDEKEYAKLVKKHFAYNVTMELISQGSTLLATRNPYDNTLLEAVTEAATLIDDERHENLVRIVQLRSRLDKSDFPTPGDTDSETFKYCNRTLLVEERGFCQEYFDALDAQKNINAQLKSPYKKVENESKSV